MKTKRKKKPLPQIALNIGLGELERLAKQQEANFFDGMLAGLANPALAGPGVPADAVLGFGSHMAMQQLIVEEERIILSEAVDKIPTAVAVAEYVAKRGRLVKALGREKFDQVREEMVASHNVCARLNLGSSGLMYTVVLPVFRDDGTHDPYGERDVPWGRVPK